MTMTDPIADMLTRIRNANAVKKESVDIPSSKMKEEIARVLKDEGYIEAYKKAGTGTKQVLRVYLKYHGKDQKQTISHIERISKPGRRVYVKGSEISEVLGGLGIAVFSTSKGFFSGEQAKKMGIGGEHVCSVW